jgi:transposase
VNMLKKQKYRCSCSDCQHIETALGPDTPKPVKGGRYTLDFAIQVILDKYASHLPLDRQSRRMKELGLTASSQTLWDYTWACAKWLLPTYEALRLDVLDESIVGADETRWRLMGKNKNAKPQIFALTSDAGVWYGFEHDKTAETLDRLLGAFDGVLIADGLSIYPAVRDRRELAYEQLESERKPFTLAQCWVHARRNFIKAVRGDPHVDEVLLLIGRLYRLKRSYDPELHDVWLEWTDAVLQGIQRWMAKQRPRPSSQLKQAIGYMDERWKSLTLFRDNPAIWLDNNGTERALRLAIQGRKNHYGSRSERGMKASAVMYSLIESCSRLDIDTRAYLREALARAIENSGTAYTPAKYLADHAD